MRYRTPHAVIIKMSPDELRLHKQVRRRKYRQHNLEKHRAYDRAWNAQNPIRRKLKARRANLKKLYGLSIVEFDRMLAAQNNHCAVCGGVQLGPNGWEVGHSHTTGQVRGIVCSACNRMLAGARDKIKNLQRGISYLFVNPPTLS